MESAFQTVHWNGSFRKEECARAVEILKENENCAFHNQYNLKVFASISSFMQGHCDFIRAVGEVVRCRNEAQTAFNEGRKDNIFVSI